MVGVSWHSGCPVGRSGLRIVRVNYWDYHGYRRRGEIVASTDAAGAMGAALAEMYRHELPIRAMYRVDRFGWSGRSRGGDDYASMAAGNTSAFNCRDVTGRPGSRSPHSWGRSLDVNTWENPYRSAPGHRPQHLVAAAVPRPHRVALQLPRRRPDHGAARAALDLRQRRHPALRLRRRRRQADGRTVRAACTQYCD